MHQPLGNLARQLPAPALLVLLVTGCVTRVIPPVAPADPVTVYLTDYGRHSSILLPTADGGYDEYAFGDWEFFAQGETGLPVAIRALIGSPQSTLGRRHIEPVASERDLATVLGNPRLASFDVPRHRADALALGLEARFHAASQTPVHSDYSNLDHVPDDEHYWGGNNCNHITAAWLRQLGCEIDGPAMFSNFVVQAPHARDRANATAETPRQPPRRWRIEPVSQPCKQTLGVCSRRFVVSALAFTPER